MSSKDVQEVKKPTKEEKQAQELKKLLMQKSNPHKKILEIKKEVREATGSAYYKQTMSHSEIENVC